MGDTDGHTVTHCDTLAVPGNSPVLDYFQESSSFLSGFVAIVLFFVMGDKRMGDVIICDI